ncbi:MAG TPA: hypothetical protein VGH89_10890 [Pseudonocardia sp.]|jgi:hypothetical protein
MVPIDRATVAVHGSLDRATASWLHGQVDGLLGAGTEHLELDLRAVPDGDRSVERELAWVRDRVYRRGAHLTVILGDSERPGLDLPLRERPAHIPTQYRPETADQP